jgi:H+-transporting ATPase
VIARSVRIEGCHYIFSCADLTVTVTQMSDDTVRGLTSQQVADARAKFGSNVLPDVKPNVLMLFLKKLLGPVPIMMIATLIIAAILADYITTACMAILLLVNSSLSARQQMATWEAVRDLKASLKITARVIRDGAAQELSSVDLVPGDIIRLRLGDVVPADAQILSEAEVLCDESAVTGESAPRGVPKDDEVLCGTSIVRGEALARITRVGAESKTASRLQLIQKSAPANHQDAMLLKYIYISVAFVVVLLIVLIVTVCVRDKSQFVPLLPLFVLILIM